MKSYDFVAIGGGSAGMAAVSIVAATGARAVVVDPGPIGGLCSLNGCNPKKVLVRCTEVLSEIQRADEHGIKVDRVYVEWPRVIDRKESFTSGVTPAAERSLEKQGIDLLRGAPRFVSKDELDVAGERIKARGILIATGSTPRALEFEGADLVKVSDDILALREAPRDLVIIGAGVVAFEFGQVFARLGSRVTLLTPGSRALSGYDEDLVSVVVEVSTDLGMEIVTRARVLRVQKNGGGLRVDYEVDEETRTLGADFVLNAAGRVPAISGLDLQKGGVQIDNRGVVVNEFLRSPSNPLVFAAGDAHGRLQLSPVASYEGGVAARNFLNGDMERVDYSSIPRALYTVPPLASVGLAESEARKRGLDVEVINSEMSSWKVYAIAGKSVARAKIIKEAKSGLILGSHVFGPEAAEIINMFAMAIRFSIPASELNKMVYAYPTLASSLPYMVG